MLIRAFAQYLGTHLLVDGGLARWCGADRTDYFMVTIGDGSDVYCEPTCLPHGVVCRGVGLLALVVFKLVLIDMSSVGAILRVVSFIGAGLLMLVIGYLAPLPPKSSIEAT